MQSRIAYSADDAALLQNKPRCMTNKITPQMPAALARNVRSAYRNLTTQPAKSPTSRKEREKWGTRRASPCQIFVGIALMRGKEYPWSTRIERGPSECPCR